MLNFSLGAFSYQYSIQSTKDKGHLQSEISTLQRIFDALIAELALLRQKQLEDNAAAVTTMARLRTDLTNASKDARKAVRAEAESPLATFINRAEDRFRTTSIDLIQARRLLIEDSQGSERIALETGKSEFSGMSNTSIKLTSPSSGNPIILSTTDDHHTLRSSDFSDGCPNCQRVLKRRSTPSS